ncbi:hypothetical protein BpHYR1_031923 [Brachionus plicatilis]|uniref:Uncharacterized protein n=1 Tax=Brachionus plicatilis TaxID=10195 RepID=A0A3M7SHN1_BRAPC|nr:hypothetical protein BpHYR1_031923 [Brachionus plicatilis]
MHHSQRPIYHLRFLSKYPNAIAGTTKYDGKLNILTGNVVFTTLVIKEFKISLKTEKFALTNTVIVSYYNIN